MLRKQIFDSYDTSAMRHFIKRRVAFAQRDNMRGIDGRQDLAEAPHSALIKRKPRRTPREPELLELLYFSGTT